MSSVARTFALIELLARRGSLGMRAISRELGIPTGSTHRLLAELADERIVERTELGDWKLSYRLVQLAGIQLERISLPSLARPVLEQLAAETRETAFLAVPSGDEIVYLDKVQTDMQLQLNVELGTRRPMYCTGLGKAILAFLPEPRQRQLLARGTFVPYTPNTITDPMLLSVELQRTRERGYAVDREEIIPGVHCIAVPLLDHTNRAVGAISIAGTSPRLESARFDALVQRVVSAGRELSLRLGHVPADVVTPVVSDRAGSSVAGVS